MKDIAVRDLRPGMTVQIGTMLAKVISAKVMNGKTGDPPTMIAGGRKSAMAVKLELVVIVHPAEIMIAVDDLAVTPPHPSANCHSRSS